MGFDLKMPYRAKESHKGTFGKLLNFAGSDYMTGAAYLSSVSALKTGCGYVILCSYPKVISAVAALTPDIVFAPNSEMLAQLNQATVLTFGCGIPNNTSSSLLFHKVFENTPDIPTIIDAGGISLLSANENIKLPAELILTPHPKEASVLLGIDLTEILNDMEFYAKVISKKYNCVTVLKSHNTVVCSKNLEIYTNETGCSALAKAGSGDVLTGIIGGLLAQKCSAFDAAKLGVYLHGLCGDLAKNDLTEYGVLASDLVRYIPNAIKTLL